MTATKRGTAPIRYQDPAIQARYAIAYEKGDLEPLSCCGHVKYHHLEHVCRACMCERAECVSYMRKIKE